MVTHDCKAKPETKIKIFPCVEMWTLQNLSHTQCRATGLAGNTVRGELVLPLLCMQVANFSGAEQCRGCPVSSEFVLLFAV